MLINKLQKIFNTPNKSGIIYVDKNSNIKVDRNDDKYDIILSPHFYWIKKEKIPTSFEFQVEKIAPSIYDGELPNDSEYEYKAIKKSKNIFFVIAYNKRYILDRLKDLEDYNINKIYLAQNEFNIDKPLKININNSLIKIDDIVQKVPSKVVSSNYSIFDYIKELKLSRKSINISENSSIISNADFLKISLPLTLTLFIMFAEIFNIKSEISNQADKESNIVQKYSLPQTSFQLNNLLKKLKNIDIQQKNIKNTILILGKVYLGKNEAIELIEFKKGIMNIEIKLNKPKNAEHIKSYLLKNSVNIVSMNVVSKKLNIKIKI